MRAQSKTEKKLKGEGRRATNLVAGGFKCMKNSPTFFSLKNFRLPSYSDRVKFFLFKIRSNFKSFLVSSTGLYGRLHFGLHFGLNSQVAERSKRANF